MVIIIIVKIGIPVNKSMLPVPEYIGGIEIQFRD